MAERRGDIEDRLARLDVDHRALGGGAGGIERVGHDQRQRLAGELDLGFGEQWLVLAGAGDVVVARDVACREHGHDAGSGGRLREIEPAQAAGRDGAQHQGAMQGAGRLGDVVDIERLAGDVFQRAVVTPRGMDLAAHSASTSTARCGSAMRQ